MKRIVIGIALIVMILVGCGKPVGTLHNVQVVNKTQDSGYRYHHYNITFQNGDQKVTLHADTSNEFEALEKGVTVDVSYNENYYITEVKFSKLQK